MTLTTETNPTMDTATTGNTSSVSGSSTGSTSTGTAESTTSVGSTTDGTSSSSSGDSSSSSTGEENSCESESPYLGAGECDPYGQDCPDGFRCVPWANDGGTTWNSTRCSVLDDEPDQLGDPCTVSGTGVSGIDSCDIGLMCFEVDGDTNIGECISLCECGPVAPQCGEVGAFCAISNDGTLPICLSPCDPLMPAGCGEGSACYPISDTFVCAPDASGAFGAQGETCANINTCDPGLVCATAAAVPECPVGSSGCCTALCPLDGLDECTAGECLPWFPEGTAPPEYDNVGFCSTPV
ncbi:MAG: hypothetical protein ACRBN8_10285 [Nannocystales bacterium]